MGNYFWVGGYTGNIGAGSGYSANWQGSAVGVWTNLLNGFTGQAGDLHFGPYYWGFKQNWLEAIQVTNSSAIVLANATRPPRQGDTVRLDPQITSGHTPYSISLLYGGVSGANFYWEGGTSQAALNEFSVKPAFGNTISDLNNTSFQNETRSAVGAGQYVNNGPWRGLDTRRVGLEYFSFAPLYAPPPEVKFVEFFYDPLDIRTATLEFSPTRGTGLIRLVGNHTSTVSMTDRGSSGSTLYLLGAATTVDQRSGAFNSFSLSGNNLTIDRLQVYGRIVSTRLSPFATVNTAVECFPSRTDGQIVITCAVPLLRTETGLTNGTEMGLSGVEYWIGDPSGTGTPTINSWIAKKGVGAYPPTVYMHGFVCDYLTAENVEIRPLTPISGFEKFIYPIFRDGQLGANVTLECNKSQDPNWNNVLIGYSPSDQGLRIDHPTARINFHVGDNIKINGKEFPIGVTT